MNIDNATLFGLLLVQALVSALVLGMLMAPRASQAARWAQASLLLQALGWLAVSFGGGGRWAIATALLMLGGSLSCLWQAVALWLRPRPGGALVNAAPAVLAAGYLLLYDQPGWRAAWAYGGLSLLLAVLAAGVAWPKRHGPGSGATAVPGGDDRRWRALLLLALLPLLLVCLLRATLRGGGGGEGPLDVGLINTALGLLCQWALTLTLLALVLAWRGEIEAGLARLAQTDGLTGLPDGPSFANRAVDMISMARRHGEPLALMMLDLDRLKAVNEDHGREAGDRALALFGSCLQQQMRLGDLPGRIGGDEFAVLMARADGQGPCAMDRRMREALAARAQPELGFSFDFSAGWARLRPGDRSIDDLQRRAETALYEARKNGGARLQAEPGVEQG